MDLFQSLVEPKFSELRTLLLRKLRTLKQTQLHTCWTYFSFERTKTSINSRSRTSSNNELKNSTEQNSNPSAHWFTTTKTQLQTWNEHRKNEHKHVRPITRPVATYYTYKCSHISVPFHHGLAHRTDGWK